MQRNFFIVMLMSWLTLATTGDPALLPHGDLVYVPAGEVSSIAIERLLLNDTVPAGESPVFRLISGPAGLSIQPAADPPHLAYDPQGTAFGSFPFTYELETLDGTVRRADGVLTLIPEVQPLFGDWSAVFGVGQGGSCDVGHHAELGWYHTDRGEFVLCDFHGLVEELRVEDCTVWRIPSNGMQRTNMSARVAFVGDWDGDGVDEPGLYDPEKGEMQLFEYSTWCSSGSCLSEIGALAFGAVSTFVPVWGQWDDELDFALYDPVRARFRLPDGTEMDVASSGTGAPLAADWQGLDLQTLGVWHPDLHEVHYLADTSGQATDIFRAQTRLGPVTGQAFTGVWSRCVDDPGFLGLYDSKDRRIKLLPLRLDSDQRPLHVKVVVDPGGGG